MSVAMKSDLVLSKKLEEMRALYPSIPAPMNVQQQIKTGHILECELAAEEVYPHRVTLTELREYPLAHQHMLLDPSNTLIHLKVYTYGRTHVETLAYMIVRGTSVRTPSFACLMFGRRPIRRKLAIPGIEIVGCGFPGFNRNLDGLTNRTVASVIASSVGRHYLPHIIARDLGVSVDDGPDSPYHLLLRWFVGRLFDRAHKTRRFVGKGPGIGGSNTIVIHNHRVPELPTYPSPVVQLRKSDVLAMPRGHLRHTALTQTAAVHQHQTFNRLLMQHYPFESLDHAVSPALPANTPYLLLK